MTSSSSFDNRLLTVPYPWQVPLWDQLCQQALGNQLSHALLICGEAGLGKKDLARGLADYLLCKNPAGKRHCGSCRTCQLGHHVVDPGSDSEAEPVVSQQPDLMILAATTNSGIIGVDRVREVIEFVSKTSHSAGRKVVIVKNAEGLNINASNALLKTLEEPTPNTYIILVTDMPGRLLATLRSRCQRVEVPKPSKSIALDWLKSVTEFDDCTTELNACSGRPLQAKAMIETGEAGLRVEFLEFLGRLVSAAISPADLLGKINHLEERVVVGFLSYTSSILVKYLLIEPNSESCESAAAAEGVEGVEDVESVEARLGIDAVLKDLAQRLIATGRPRQTLCQNLMVLYTEAETARKQLQSGTNPNPALLMESLLWHWSTLAQSAKPEGL